MQLLSTSKLSMLGALAYRPWLPPYLSIACSGAILGGAAVFSMMLIAQYFLGVIHSLAWVGLAFYILVSFVVFHSAEFTCAVLFRPHDTQPDSFLFFHSVAFLIAQTVAWIELFTRWHFYGDAQWSWWRMLFFAALALAFYWVRVQAMIDAADNFSFKVEVERRETHRLVRTGVFARLRHPSYFGSFYYFVMTQVMAGNWLCVVLFIGVLRFFFQRRIETEEALLESDEFFGEEYTEYKRTTSVGLPLLNKYPFFC
jgi:protein-S-isoprenylcysteine O-methyltransferase